MRCKYCDGEIRPGYEVFYEKETFHAECSVEVVNYRKRKRVKGGKSCPVVVSATERSKNHSRS